MAEWFKRLFQSPEEKEQEQYVKILQSDGFKNLVRQQAESLLEESRREEERLKVEAELKRKAVLDNAEQTISAMTEEMQKSNKPYVVIRSLGFNPQQGIEVKLDYNPAFIKYLVTNGITGKNEDEIVRRWLAYLSTDIIQDSVADEYVMSGVSPDETPGISLEEILKEINRQQDDENESNT